MTEQISTIENLNIRDWFDYVSAFSPLFLSCIAIFIALYTSRKQNTISIFEKRYNNYSELIDFFSIWKMFIEQFNRLYEQNEENFVDLICKLCLPLSIIGLNETKNFIISDYVKDQKIDRDKVRDALLDLQFKNSKTLEMASLINGRYSRRIDLFRRKHILFYKAIEKVTLGKTTKDEFYKDVIDFKESIDAFYKLVQKRIRPKVKIVD